MDSKVRGLVEKYYQEFAGLPNNNPIVRNGIKEDAYTLAILDLMYSGILNITIEPQEIDRIRKIIVAPPDSGIDLFVEIEDGDEYYYDIIQSKYCALTENEIKKCFSEMSRTMKDYLKNPGLVKPNLRAVISETSFSAASKNNCTYYVVHTGELNYGKGFTKSEKIVTINELETLSNSLLKTSTPYEAKVPYDEFKADAFNNYILYDQSENSEQALLCNLRGFDLAELCNKYASTSMGRNILFGQNLRDSLDSKSKTYKDMEATINKEPHRFWHYNNGITIITEKLDAHKDQNENVDLIELTNFSIINGAQTTSALGTYLKNAMINDDEEAKERLKKVYVLARIMEVRNSDLRDNISIYNNSQNPITSRDMVANRIEQKKLHETYMQGEKPYIYVEIRRGSVLPSFPRFEKHQRTTNEELAQLAFAAFLSKPFYAKDKKSTLFNKDYSNDDVVINEYYHQIFYYPEDTTAQPGILFERTRREIDEALFIKYLYKQAKSLMKKKYDERIAKSSEKIKLAGDKGDSSAEQRMKLAQRNKEINNTCMFYCIALYYEIKKEFFDIDAEKDFDYDKFYRNRDSDYKTEIINYFAENFLSKTIEIISKLLEGTGNVGNWIRKSSSQDVFLNELNNEIMLDSKLEDMFTEFVERFKK